MAEYSIGIDLGGTNLRAAAIGRDGKMIDKVAMATDFVHGREAVLNDITSAIGKLRDKYGAGDLKGIGVGVPGFIRMKEGYLTNSPNLPYFENFPVRDELSKRANAPVVLENDANAAAMGEKWIGAGKEHDDLVLLTLGTGIGGGIISGGHILRGFVGMAGELGHITVVPNGNPCACGNRGCLEKSASATAIVAMAHMLHLGENLSSKDVADLAKLEGETGDKARSIFRTMGEALGIALATLVNTFNFPLYLLSGGPLPSWDLFAPEMFRVVEQRSYTYRATKPAIEKATLGNEAGLYGAAYLPWE
ncbi:MAG TPA: ROK family protein [Bryobacteraceae bacterium]|nr:ROK family protein [Bryobacteraceae bacterium]